jgi:hypothetical protein
MSATRLAKKAGLSDATVSAALSDKRIAEESLDLIRHVLESNPASEFLKRLIPPFRPPEGDQPPASPGAGHE